MGSIPKNEFTYKYEINYSRLEKTAAQNMFVDAAVLVMLVQMLGLWHSQILATPQMRRVGISRLVGSLGHP